MDPSDFTNVHPDKFFTSVPIMHFLHTVSNAALETDCLIKPYTI